MRRYSCAIGEEAGAKLGERRAVRRRRRGDREADRCELQRHIQPCHLLLDPRERGLCVRGPGPVARVGSRPIRASAGLDALCEPLLQRAT